MNDAPKRFPIVGIGASAGGVQALEGLFRGVPSDSDCAFVVVTHLSPDRKSMLPEIVARYTEMPVHVTEDGATVRPNEVHIMPAAAILGMRGCRLTIEPMDATRRERKPIDVFFSALAADAGEYAVGIVLSGGDSDGTLGVKAIRERGGLTLAQASDGSRPQYPDMPESAIASGMIDLALPVEEMGGRLAAFARSFGTLAPLLTQVEAAPEESALAEAREEISTILRNRIGHDFSGYKPKTFLRRVRRRMQVHHLESIQGYVDLLRQDPQEVEALFRDLLISVTDFFRDTEGFEAIRAKVIPELFEGRGAQDTIRVWVPGCATGEEAYSIASMLREHMDSMVAVPRVQVFATDIDARALAVARAARYPEVLLKNMSPERRDRFFTLDGGSYVVSKSVRELCVFSPHNVIQDPPFSRLDLISCRNLLIYLGVPVQNQVIPTFHYALRPGGFLFLGMSESIGQYGDLFAPVDKQHRIFRSRNDGHSRRIRLPVGWMAAARPLPFATPGSPPRPSVVAGLQLRQAVEAQVLERFAPAHVVVTADGDVVHFSPRTGKYLEATSGAPAQQLLTMARKGLRLELRAALRESVRSRKRVVRTGLAVETDEGAVQGGGLTVEPFGGGDEPLYLVLFTDDGPIRSRQDTEARASAPDKAALHLEADLRETRERLQSMIEEYETALEELKSSNEELVSLNEEMQSTNEELEASKEELQSLNEELHTVNADLQSKIESLDRANSDLRNLFDTTRVATVFLDRNMAIRTFTPAMTELYNILPSDHGRPLTDLSGRLDLPDLEELVRTVLETGRTIERNLDRGDGGPHYLMRLAPYRIGDGSIDGAALTFVDVTTLTLAEAQQRVLIAELNHRVKNMLTVVIGLAEQTYKTAADPMSFKAGFVDRLHAMARSYELLSRESWIEASIRELIAPEVAPFGAERVILDGPEIRLSPRQALSLGMVVHELATNAGKYGSLSAENGRVEVRWERRVADRGDVSVVWREVDGPPPDGAPAKVGFGLKLVKREMEYSLGGKADMDFTPAGLVVTLVFPETDETRRLDDERSL